MSLLICPIRGGLNIDSLAKDGLTISEEARRIDFIKFLLTRDYPKENIAVETVVIKHIGESGRNKVRCDVMVYKKPVEALHNENLIERLKNALLIAEIKRDGKKKDSGIHNQLVPALHQIPNINALGVYWDDTSRLLFIKNVTKIDGDSFVEITVDNLENLPSFGKKYLAKPLRIEDLSKPDDFTGLLFEVANVMRSHGIYDEQLRYKESVKLILARYCDEIEAESSKTRELSLQVLQNSDTGFMNRVQKYYTLAGRRYNRAKSLFYPISESELPERTLKEIIKLIQGVYFRKASTEMMQQVFQSFVPAVFKKNLDQYFTPNTLIESMVSMVNIGPLDKIADPAMGTGDFLTGAMDYRSKLGDTDIIQRIYGSDIDSKAYDLAVINMILNKDGQSNLIHEDSIEKHNKWSGEIDVALCNPPFGEKSIENRSEILKEYDLGHQWIYDEPKSKWIKTEKILHKQQLGILFIEKCYKMLTNDGRLAIILPEGYLCTISYTYLRQWIIDRFRIVTIVELPRRIFLKSDADLRSNILVLQKKTVDELNVLKQLDYPIHAEIVRKVGYKLGKGFSIEPLRDPKTGLEIRDENNDLIIDTDFTSVISHFQIFKERYKIYEPAVNQSIDNPWPGARFSDISSRSDLDLKPRRLTIKALDNIRIIKDSNHVKLGEIADVVQETIDISIENEKDRLWQLISGQSIRAVEGTVIPDYPTVAWEICEQKGSFFYKAQDLDIVIGLVRPERRNTGMILSNDSNLIASPDGVSIVRVKEEYKSLYPQEWIFSIIRSEKSRLQFWTESGGTSYGKLNKENIENILLPTNTLAERIRIKENVSKWVMATKASFNSWDDIWEMNDKFPIVNSPIFGLETEDF